MEISKLHSIFVFIIISLIGASAGRVLSSARDPITYVGQVDGIAYFVYNSTFVNWHEADDLCKSSGMELATITTQNQRELLGNAIPRHNGNFFWSAATDSRDLSIVKWPNSNHPSSDLFDHYIGSSIPQICGMVYFESATSAVMDLVNCANKQRPMCQAASHRL